jgi:phytoene dehydrogenase-like protein
MDLSRRQMLASFLGLPAAVSACKTARSLPEGKIVFPSQTLGHKLRDQAPPEIGPARFTRTGVVIVGGGVAGLSAAWRLRRAGFSDFVVLELDPVVGGTAKSERSSVSAYPWGAHYITVPMKENRALIALLGEMGVIEGQEASGEPVVREEVLCRDPQERLFHDGTWYEGLYLSAGASPQDKAELTAFRREIDRWATMRDARGRRAFAIPTAHSSPDAEVASLDRISMAEWLTGHGWRSERLRWFVEYACRDDYGSTLEHTSAYAGVFYFASRTGAGSEDTQPVITWPEGNGRLVNHLHAQVHDNVRLGLAAADVAPFARDGQSGVEVVAVTVDGTASGFRADQVIFAAPRFVAARVIRPWREAPPSFLAEFEYGAWMVANLTLRDRPRSHGLRFAWDNVLYDSPSLGYVVATHQRALDHGPTVLTYYYPLCDADPRAARTRLLAAGWADWAEVALTDLSRAHPEIRDLCTRLDVMRWGHAMIRPRPGFMRSKALRDAAVPFRGVHFAHADLSGVALFEEAFDHGLRAAEEVLAVRGLPFEGLR